MAEVKCSAIFFSRLKLLSADMYISTHLKKKNANKEQKIILGQKECRKIFVYVGCIQFRFEFFPLTNICSNKVIISAMQITMLLFLSLKYGITVFKEILRCSLKYSIKSDPSLRMWRIFLAVTELKSTSTNLTNGFLSCFSLQNSVSNPLPRWTVYIRKAIKQTERNNLAMPICSVDKVQNSLVDSGNSSPVANMDFWILTRICFNSGCEFSDKRIIPIVKLNRK